MLIIYQLRAAVVGASLTASWPWKDATCKGVHPFCLIQHKYIHANNDTHFISDFVLSIIRIYY
jgi:hypothetical protein